MLCEQVIARTWSVSTPDELRESLETLSRIVETIASYADGSGYGSALADHGLRGTNVALARKGRSFESERRSLSLAARNALDRIVDGAARRLANKQDEPDLYFDSLALRLLRFGRFDKVNGSITSIAETGTDQAMRLAAIETFASFAQPEVDAWLIERYRSETPAIRRAILAALFASKERQLRLLEAIEQKQIAATELDPVRVNQLTQAKDETIRERAKKILAAAAPASRKEVLDAYQSALSLKGDPQRGKAVFVKNCSTCHRVDNVGVNVAPDISDTRTKKPEQLLLDILDPNKAIDANYFAYVVVTKEGKTESGVISSESSNSITLKQPEGKVLTLLRSDIEELRNTGLSLMPVGVEKNIDQQAMTDLIFWLKNWRYLDGKVPATSIEPK
jgi:putative heme-binding domain-containing protein